MTHRFTGIVGDGKHCSTPIVVGASRSPLPPLVARSETDSPVLFFTQERRHKDVSPLGLCISRRKSYGRNFVVNAFEGSKGLSSSFCSVMKVPKFCQTSG